MEELVKKIINTILSILTLKPPWWFPPRNNSNTKFGGGVTDKYPVMKLDEIRRIPINELADDNCALLMWVTTSSTSDSNLSDRLSLFKHWGFDLKNEAFTWVKLNAKSETPFFGTGYYSKSNAEHCYLGVKGKMKPVSNKISSLIMAKREQHSKKPEIIRDKIVELFGDLPRVEIFARKIVDGWDSIGNEINGEDIRTSGLRRQDD